MPRRWLRYAFAALATVLVIAAIAVGVTIHRQIRRFAVEDRIHGTYYPLVDALSRFSSDKGRPAKSVEELVPDYLADLPASDLVDDISYRPTADGHDWMLALHSQALSPGRTYCFRSNHDYSPAEEKRILIRYHGGWTVLADP